VKSLLLVGSSSKTIDGAPNPSRQVVSHKVGR